MLSTSQLEKYDSSGMHKIYDKWPQFAKESFELNHDTIDFGTVNHIVFAGMGGSGAIGDVLAAVLSKTDPAPIKSIDFIKNRLLKMNKKHTQLENSFIYQYLFKKIK